VVLRAPSRKKVSCYETSKRWPSFFKNYRTEEEEEEEEEALLVRNTYFNFPFYVFLPFLKFSGKSRTV
jgi:hypothetical protein